MPNDVLGPMDKIVIKKPTFHSIFLLKRRFRGSMDTKALKKPTSHSIFLFKRWFRGPMDTKALKKPTFHSIFLFKRWFRGPMDIIALKKPTFHGISLFKRQFKKVVSWAYGYRSLKKTHNTNIQKGCTQKAGCIPDKSCMAGCRHARLQHRNTITKRE